MKYSPPKDENGTPYYVPIVAKNRDTLIGYIRGIADGKDIMTDVLESIDIKLDLGPMDVVLDSTRFNDLLQNGKYESDMKDEELQSYIYDIVGELTDKMTDDNSENNIKSENVLAIECVCDLGYYAWDSLDKIPHETFKCGECGKVLIHYSGDFDYDYDYHEGDR